MTEENNLVIRSKLDLDTSDKSNKAFLRLYKDRRQGIINRLQQISTFIEVIKKLEKGKSYRAIIPLEHSKRLYSGTARFGKRDGGLLSANIHDVATGNFLSQVSLEEVPPELSPSINQLAIQSTLADIVHTLESIDKKITDVLQGQRNDRLATVDSGIALYSQAIVANEKENRRHLLLSAVTQLNEGRHQLIKDLESEIKFFDNVPQGKFQIAIKTFKHDLSTADIERRARLIQRIFQAILKASYVMLLAYSALEEDKPMRASLQPLKNTINIIRKQGYQIGRLLPYDPDSPPEEFWGVKIQQLDDNLKSQTNKLEVGTKVDIELEFTSDEFDIGGDS